MIKIMKRRYIGIDILRIVSVIVVFAFHANMHVGVSWGGLNGVYESFSVNKDLKGLL